MQHMQRKLRFVAARKPNDVDVALNVAACLRHSDARAVAEQRQQHRARRRGRVVSTDGNATGILGTG
jgi:hypothetical protein